MFSNDTAVESSKKSDGFIIKTVQVVLGRKLDSQEYINYNYERVLHFVLQKIKRKKISDYLSRVDA